MATTARAIGDAAHLDSSSLGASTFNVANAQLNASDYRNTASAENARIQDSAAPFLHNVNITADDSGGLRDRLLTNAQQDVGQELWNQVPEVWNGQKPIGDYGCAASVSEVLKQSGVPVESASVTDMRNKLIDQGWTEAPISQAQPGDVVVGLAGDPKSGGSFLGDGAHTGIVSSVQTDDNGNQQIRVLNNNSLNGDPNGDGQPSWSETSLGQKFGEFPYVTVLKPPADN